MGAEISSEKSSKGVEDDLHKIIGVCDVCFKDGEPQQIDCILNSIVSIMITVFFRGIIFINKKFVINKWFTFSDSFGSWRKHRSSLLREND